MSERWKYQFKVGIFWGLFMTLFNLVFEMQEKPVMMQITSPSFYLRMLVFTLTGIFLLGYINWKAKAKKAS